MIPNWLRALVWAVLIAAIFRTSLIMLVDFLQWTE